MESMLEEEETFNNSDESDEEEILDEIVVDTSIQDEPDDEENEGACDRSKELVYLTPPLTDPELEESPEAIFTASLPIRHRSDHPEGVDNKGHNSNCCHYKSVPIIDSTNSIRFELRQQFMVHLMLGSSFNHIRETYQKLQRL
ncbi:hypothetical protein E5D57_000050 [Metarhizium anisopliae]|nr:hypothetical protein E5D57_000050 [Metarhizium anisopliae]